MLVDILTLVLCMQSPTTKQRILRHQLFARELCSPTSLIASIDMNLALPEYDIAHIQQRRCRLVQRQRLVHALITSKERVCLGSHANEERGKTML